MLHARPTPAHVALAALVTTLAWSPGAAAQQEPPAAYTQLIKNAAVKYKAKDYRGAIDDFERAYSLYSEPDVIYNIARVYEKMGNFKQAVRYYDQFVNLPDIELKARQDALARGKALREVLELREPKPDPTPQPPVVELKPDPAPAPGPRAQPEAISRAPELVLVGVGSGALVAGGVFAWLTGDTHERFERAVTLEQRRDASTLGRTYATVADVLWISGASLLVVGAITYVVRTEDDAPIAHVRPVLSPEHAGFDVHMRF